MNISKTASKSTESEFDITTTYTIMTPPETVTSEVMNEKDYSDNVKSSSSSVPWPGHLYIINSVVTGQVLTLLGGNLVMAKPGGRGSIHWACVEKNGWLGFRNPVSGKFLGHDQEGNLRCSVDQQNNWERFCVRMKPEGGYVLYMTHYNDLWTVGLQEQKVDVKTDKKAAEKLAKSEKGEPIVWEFVKV
jgi:hypothetical protein